MEHGNRPLCDLYVAPIPDVAPSCELWPPEREREIAQTRNERAKKEKYYVWRLLELALRQSLGLELREIGVFKNENQKWGANGVFFSLSHTSGAVAVAVSNAPVGVDIEQYHTPRADRLAARVLTARELADYQKAPQRDEFLLQKWVAKEAIFKASDKKVFSPANTETTDAGVTIGTLDQNGTRYTFALATAAPDHIRIFKDIDLTKE